MLENTSEVTTTTEAIDTTPATPDVGGDISNTPPATPSEVQAYTPSDFKFKYTGKNGDKWGDAEGELDEVIRGAIKSKEDEEKWKKFYSKAYGFDFVADGREKARGELTQYKSQAEPILKYAQEATKAWKAGDLDTFFEVLGVPHDKLQQYVYNKLQQQELPPEHRTAIEQNRQMQRQMQALQEQMQSYQQNSFQTQQQALYNELNAELSKPEIKAIVEAFDKRANEIGAVPFHEVIRQQGEYIFMTQNGRIARPSELIQNYIKMNGLQAPVAAEPQVHNNTIPAQLSTDKPTIPVVKGGGASPSGKSFKSLKDLESYRKEKYGY